MPGIFFVSDIHLGLQSGDEERLKLDMIERLFAIIKAEGRSLYLLGDILDYWMEYRHVIPKGFSRFLCLLSDLVRHGVDVSYLAGNHDFYLGRYFDEELGVRTLYGLHEASFDGKQFVLAHGDGLGPGDIGYKLFARFVRNRFNLGFLTAFHPDLATALMKRFSRLSRDHKPGNMQAESDRLLHFAASLARERVFDYFVCGHNHARKMQVINESCSWYVNLGSWIEGRYPYGIFDKGRFEIREV
jgi:UDP-2,3-diacylglucosamine hydrolase